MDFTDFVDFEKSTRTGITIVVPAKINILNHLVDIFSEVT